MRTRRLLRRRGRTGWANNKNSTWVRFGGENCTWEISEIEPIRERTRASDRERGRVNLIVRLFSPPWKAWAADGLGFCRELRSYKFDLSFCIVKMLCAVLFLVVLKLALIGFGLLYVLYYMYSTYLIG